MSPSHLSPRGTSLIEAMAALVVFSVGILGRHADERAGQPAEQPGPQRRPPPARLPATWPTPSSACPSITRSLNHAHLPAPGRSGLQRHRQHRWAGDAAGVPSPSRGARPLLGAADAIVQLRGRGHLLPGGLARAAGGQPGARQRGGSRRILIMVRYPAPAEACRQVNIWAVKYNPEPLDGRPRDRPGDLSHAHVPPLSRFHPDGAAVGAAVGAVVLMGISLTFISQAQQYQAHASRRGIQASARQALAFMERHLRARRLRRRPGPRHHPLRLLRRRHQHAGRPATRTPSRCTRATRSSAAARQAATRQLDLPAPSDRSPSPCARGRSCWSSAQRTRLPRPERDRYPRTSSSPWASTCPRHASHPAGSDDRARRAQLAHRRRRAGSSTSRQPGLRPPAASPAPPHGGDDPPRRLLRGHRSTTTATPPPPSAPRT